MMAPLPNPTPGDRPDLPRVRFDVRTAAGRVIGHDFTGEEFLIGAAPGCDLRLNAPGSPPVAVQLTRRSDGVRVRRIAVALPVTLNDDLLPTGGAVLVQHADTLQVAGVLIGVHIPSQIVAAPPTEYLSPKLVPLDEVPLAVVVSEEPPAPDLSAEYERLDARRRALDAEEADRRAVWDARDAEFIRRRRELDLYAEELEADRTLWYDRRQAIEQELADLRASEAAAKEAELARTRDELAGLRRQWVEECQSQREELIRRAEQLQTERTAWEAERATHEPQAQALRDDQTRLGVQAQELSRQRDLFAADRDIFERERTTFDAQKGADADRFTSWEADLTTREGVVSEREGLVRAARDEFESERLRFQEDLTRLERRSAALEEAERTLALRTQEVDVRLDQLKRDAIEWEETVGLVTQEQERLRTEAERLDRQKTELDAQSAGFAERAAQLEAQQAVVAVFRAKLDRSRQDMEREAWQLAAARTREDEALAELRRRIQEAEEVRAALSAVQENADQERRRLDERDSLLTAGLEEIRVQQEQIAAEAARLREREAELDTRTAEFAEQAGMLKGRMSQAVDLQSRLEADRVALREREAALSQSEEARQALQEQLRRRAEELSARGKALDEQVRLAAAERVQVEQARATIEGARQATEDELTARQQELEARAAALERQAVEFATKEEALARQVSRLKDVGAAVAAERKSLATARTAWETDRAAAQAADREAREQLEAFRSRAAADLDALRAQAPELDDQAKLALERLSAARGMLRGHLNELNEFARTSRADLEAARTQVREEAERLRERTEALDHARDENRLDAKQAAATEAATAASDAAKQLAEETDRLRREREELTVRRTEVERHLSDMREWYRKKLRELTQSRADGKRAADAPPPDDDVPPAPKLHDPGTPAPDTPLRIPAAALAAELEPGDLQLGELLRSLGLVDAETVTALWEEATRQRRPLRKVLLDSGAITLYQLALIEAGNLDALVLGRLRVIDRLRATPREAIYRVFDPKRAGERSGGLYLLRHLSEGEMQDAVHPDEFRQRFSAARDAAHPNLAGVVEVLEINGRPAVLLEWLTGLFSADWPAFAAHPGCWVRLATMAASALDTAHRGGLVHGRLTSDSFVLTPEGVLKVTDFGEPGWLAPVPGVSAEASVAADLRTFGQVAFGWSQLAGKKRVARSKGFPESVWGVMRRLEADAEPPMADTVPMAQPYQSAAELLADLQRIARDTPFSDDAWEKLLKHVLDNAPDVAIGLKKAG